jgi:biopolymer transport protein TolR
MSDINMTPLIDVMLVLLVIFIITAPLLVSSVAPKFVEITIDREGQVLVDDKVQTSDGLGTLFDATAKANADAEVRLRADTTVPYGRVVEVMGQAQKAGLSHIGFVADAPDKAKP